jgi:two-component system phosphate regulon response regulator OmpR
MTTANAQRTDRIAVVDDDARIRDLLRRYLTQEGFEVLLAEDSKALNRILTRETDRKSTRLNSSHNPASRMPSSA